MPRGGSHPMRRLWPVAHWPTRRMVRSPCPRACWPSPLHPSSFSEIVGVHTKSKQGSHHYTLSLPLLYLYYTLSIPALGGPLAGLNCRKVSQQANDSTPTDTISYGSTGPKRETARFLYTFTTPPRYCWTDNSAYRPTPPFLSILGQPRRQIA